MQELNIIKTFSEEERGQLTPDKLSKHANRVIRETLIKYKNGITLKDMEKLTGFAKLTVEKHLVELIAINFAYRKKFGITFAYYPNGRTMHPLSERDVPIGDKFFSIFRLDNNDNEKYIYIQEKKYDSVNALKPSGGLLVKEQMFHAFIDMLNDAKENMSGVDVESKADR